MNTTNQTSVSTVEPKRQAHEVSRSHPQTITSEQLRAARSLLDWTRKDLAEKSGLSPETIKNIEHGIFSPMKQTILALVETFARHGVQFIHYETLITVPAGYEQVGRLQALSYVGAVRVTASIPDIREEDNG